METGLMTHCYRLKTLPLVCGLLLSLIFFGLTAYGEEAGQGEIPYGENSAVGGYAQINGIEMYYEVYGEGDPLVLIHGSGQSIEAMKHQIEHFAKRYKVVVADSRAHGKSGLGEGTLTYGQMADDWAALFDVLGLGKTSVIGWSDGGNISLMLAIHHADKVDKIAIMGANLQPDASAVQPWAVDWVAAESEKIDQMLAAGDSSANWAVQKQQFGLLREQPDISLEQLAAVSSPVLVMAGDRDVIRGEHTLLMFQTLPNAHLAIFPGATHFIPDTNPALFNATVEKFLQTPFSRPDTRDIMLGH
jgi:pimeloyl-ACP methyl ester carboxylesterase